MNDKKQSQLLTSAMMSIKESVYITDMDDSIIFVNDAFKKIYGYDEDIIGKQSSILWKDGSSVDLSKTVEDSFDTEYYHVQKDGSEFPVFLSRSFIRDEKGRDVALISIARSYTEKLVKDEDSIKAEKHESLSTLARGIAHDFNNILTAILGNISLAKMVTSTDNEVHELIAEIEEASLMARDLTHQLVDFSSKKASFERTTSIGGIVSNSITSAMKASKSQCEIHFPDDIWPVDIDVRLISHVIGNLVNNADHAMPEGGIISVNIKNVDIDTDNKSLSKPGKYVMISVHDHGVGIPNENIYKIFDPYFTTRRKARGMGLAVAYSIITNHKGHMTVESEIDIGSTFNIFLPASGEDETANKD